ncbi:YicC/YloC family endoribonuclease [Thiorhodospira sibirica]|uniref:YicC/YloC family endoribonuclease n=1 Tax=Thiorhodospira sibirica TaxID=154347 RepID=UPI00022C04EB|nr:YicC/YloC family endoribonuclease [Thiorhodospira sibirica]
MTHSMTGYARCESSGTYGTLSWELKSLNHRFLDLSLRLPEALRCLEGSVRESLQATLSRGKIEATLRYRPNSAQSVQLEINKGLAQGLIAACREAEGMLSNSARITPLDFLAWPGLVSTSDTLPEAASQAALQLLHDSLQALNANRADEGRRLASLVLERCESLSHWVGVVRQRRPVVLEALRTRLQQRIAELTLSLDATRLEQEIALQAQRLDVAEELDRLDAHILEMRKVFARTEAIGRRLDFLTQEMHREANTLSAKANDLETTQATVEMKVLIEQIREQIQNIE